MTNVELIFAALDDEWRTTQEIAARAGISHRPGSHDLRPVRDALYALSLPWVGGAEQEPRHNGHLWRRAQPQEGDFKLTGGCRISPRQVDAALAAEGPCDGCEIASCPNWPDCRAGEGENR